MKLSNLVVLPALFMVATTAATPALATGDTNEPQFSESIKTILINAPGEMSIDEIEFFDKCFKDAYNSLHDPNDVHIDDVAMEYQEYHGEPDALANGDGPTVTSFLRKKTNTKHLSPYFFWRYTISFYHVGGGCRYCAPDPDISLKQTIQDVANLKNIAPAVVHRELEHKLLAMLQGGPFDYFQDIGDCIVDFSGIEPRRSIPPLPIMDNNSAQQRPIQQQAETILVGVGGGMDDPQVQQHFLESWKRAYNDFHGPGMVHIEEVSIDSDEYNRGPAVHLDAAVGNYIFCPECFHSPFDIVFVNAKGNCRGCAHDDNSSYSDGFPPLLDAMRIHALSQNVDPLVIHRAFEMRLMRFLKESQSEFFKNLEECIVDLSGSVDPPQPLSSGQDYVGVFSWDSSRSPH